MWQTNAVALRAGDEAMLIDSPYFPDELEALPGAARRRRLRARRAARHARATSTTCSGGWRSRASRSGSGRAERGAPPPRARRRRSATCATTTPSSTWSGRRRWRSARCRPSRCPVGVELGDRGARASPRRGPHRRRHWRSSRAGAGVLCVGDYLSRRGDPDDLGRAARSPSTAPRSPGWRRWWRRRTRSCPGTALRTTASAALRLLDEDVDYLDALERGDERRGCPRAATPSSASSAGSTAAEPYARV